MRKFYIVKGFENENISLPVRATAYSAGYDLAAAKDYAINSKEICLIQTGIKVQMNADEVFKIYPRSSLAKKKGLFLANHVGIIDADYFNNPENDGHIMINVYNFSDDVVKIVKGERIAQGIFEKYYLTDDDITAKEKRKGGFGSTTL